MRLESSFEKKDITRSVSPAAGGAAAAGRAAAAREATPSASGPASPASRPSSAAEATEAAAARPPAASAECPPQAPIAAREHREDHEDEEEEERAGAPLNREARASPRSFVHCRAGPLVLALRRRDHRVDARLDSSRIVVSAESRDDLVFDDALRRDVRQHALETVSHLDPQLAVIDEHEQNGAVVLLRLSDPPLLVRADGEVLEDEVLRDLPVDPHEQLVRRVTLELLELAVQRFGAIRGKHAGAVG